MGSLSWEAEINKQEGKVGMEQNRTSTTGREWPGQIIFRPVVVVVAVEGVVVSFVVGICGLVGGGGVVDLVIGVVVVVVIGGVAAATTTTTAGIVGDGKITGDEFIMLLLLLLGKIEVNFEIG
jgi:hypothetical protein